MDHSPDRALRDEPSEPISFPVPETARPDTADRPPFLPVDRDDEEEEEDEHRGWRQLLPLLLFVLLPTILVASFEYFIAANQYESEARFIVRAPQIGPSASDIGQMLGLAGTTTPADAHSVREYLLSHDAVDALDRSALTAVFRRPEADAVTRLWSAAPEPEALLDYYQGKVHISAATETGITSLTVRAFRPEDAKHLADRLLKLGEQRVNSLNQRMLTDGLSAADRQVREAEADVQTAEVELTRFRQTHREIDPERSSAAQIQLASALDQQAATARANFQAMAATISSNAPQYNAAARQASALEAQAAAVRAKLTGSENSLAPGLGEYEKLQIKKDFAAKRYQAAASGYQSAREQLLKQQLFIIPVVTPNLPGKALYPKRLTTVATVFCGLLLAYAIGWLILAGVREHAT